MDYTHGNVVPEKAFFEKLKIYSPQVEKIQRDETFYTLFSSNVYFKMEHLLTLIRNIELDIGQYQIDCGSKEFAMDDQPQHSRMMKRFTAAGVLADHLAECIVSGQRRFLFSTIWSGFFSRETSSIVFDGKIDTQLSEFDALNTRAINLFISKFLSKEHKPDNVEVFSGQIRSLLDQTDPDKHSTV